ncbi:MAG: lipopolysaccharide heptosyltransferase II [Omnitrophica bacterium]|nr:lipopolysaccharide heptosyltransferase II [Candidatus Omnitrophota bacterium]
MKRILVVSVNWLGDSVLCLPIFKALKNKFPASYIGVMAVKRLEDIFECNPYIDEVIAFDERESQKSLKGKVQFIKLLRAKKFDTVFFVQRSFTRVLLCFLGGIKSRIGYRRLKNSFVLTTKIDMPKGLMHRQDYYFYLFEKTGIEITDKTVDFSLPEDARSKISKFLLPISQNHSFIIGINPSANWEMKRWPGNYFAELCKRLVKELNAGIIFVGAAKERPLVSNIRGMLGVETYDYCGETTLKELAVLLKNTDLFISNDSGPAHLAASLGVKTLVIFGPTSDLITAPRGKFVKIIKKDVNCKIPCYNAKCPNNVCMKNISVSDVFVVAKETLDEHSEHEEKSQ